MPFQSDKQRAYLYANLPSVAEKFAQDSKSAPAEESAPTPEAYTPSVDSRKKAMANLVNNIPKN